MTDAAPEPPTLGTVHHLADHRRTPTADPINLVKPITPTAEALTGTVLPPQGDAVDRPDNPLADWLTVPDLPILPPWARSAAALKANAGAAARLAGYHAGFHSVRLPKYGVRVTWLAAKGTWRVTVRLWPVLTCHEHTKVVRALAAQLAAKETGPELALAHRTAHRARTVARRWRFGTATAAAAGAGMALMVASAPVLVTVSAILLGLLAVVGRKDADVPLLDRADVPLRLDLSAQQLNEALRAAGLLKAGKGDDEGPRVACVMGPVRDGKGWACIFDLPRGGGKTASDVLAKREVLAQELGVDEIQLIMSRVRAAKGGNAGRVSLWVADDDPYLADPTPSPLAKLERFSIWDPIPFGQDARGNRITVPVIWQSMFFGGLPRRGKTFTQRIMTAAGLLDPWVRHYVADFKGGQDWMGMKHVAHRLVLGAEDDAIEAFKAMLKELLAEMERRFALFRGLPTSICPEGKLTPAIVEKYGMPFIFLTVDELQEAFLAMDDKAREEVVDDLGRIARRGPAAGFISNYASQRPDAKSVPTKLREIITIRCCTQVTDKTSSDMVLGSGKAAMGADASLLSEDHKGVTVLVTGPASHATVKNDLLTTAEFNAMCLRGRALREAIGQITGDAAGDITAVADSAGIVIAPVLSDCLDAMRHSDRMHTVDLLARLVNADEDRYGDWDGDKLAAELEAAGVERTSKQVKINGSNRAGYRRADLEAAVPAELLLSARATDPAGGPAGGPETNAAGEG
ncbi:FtsK/SpoIIIE domain-containing protein [Streptomyces sp. SL13]|uniref:FtsK/SpoIIIE domain-containing protein n=1 Tax=Streptantibioticus silvisoli TaxID=2705255 RepID=A0AA90GV37_9ACTN|nr:FtsK/SpoIIIE domain-containing protein [Streptantibioticus silvisoli]MDI5968628.1 FtsK/SpoIIIE domain-containing protein [Streptantibioticus silvisoli]